MLKDRKELIEHSHRSEKVEKHSSEILPARGAAQVGQPTGELGKGIPAWALLQADQEGWATSKQGPPVRSDQLGGAFCKTKAGGSHQHRIARRNRRGALGRVRSGGPASWAGTPSCRRSGGSGRISASPWRRHPEAGSTAGDQGSEPCRAAPAGLTCSRFKTQRDREPGLGRSAMDQTADLADARPLLQSPGDEESGGVRIIPRVSSDAAAARIRGRAAARRSSRPADHSAGSLGSQATNPDLGTAFCRAGTAIGE